MEELSLVLNSAIPGASQSDYVLLDGGASHDVSISPTIPKGSIEKEVKLAHGSKKGYVKDGCITLVDNTKNLENSIPKLMSLGRLIDQCDLKFSWSRTGATLELPKGKSYKLRWRTSARTWTRRCSAN